jgi:hypothetical protein
MPDFRFVVEVFAPPFHVWETLLDVARWPEWTQSVTSIERLDSGPLSLGSRARILQPRLIPAVWKVTELDPRDRVFVWQTGKPGIRLTAAHRVDRTDQGARVTLTLTYGGLLGPLMAYQLKDLNWSYITMEAQGLKARCESLLHGPTAVTPTP